MKVRRFLIRLIAGGRPVVMNVHVEGRIFVGPKGNRRGVFSNVGWINGSGLALRWWGDHHEHRLRLVPHETSAPPGAEPDGAACAGP